MIAERLSDSLPSALTDGAAADGKWDVSVRRDSYPVDEHAEVLEVIRTVDPAGETEDIVIYLTDLPRRLGTTPVIADISVHDRFGLISIPGVGGLFIDRRVRNLAQTVVAEVTCQSRQATPICEAADTDTGGRCCPLRRADSPVTSAASDGHGLRQPPVAIGCWYVQGVDGCVRRWGGEPCVSDDLAVVRPPWAPGG